VAYTSELLIRKLFWCVRRANIRIRSRGFWTKDLCARVFIEDRAYINLLGRVFGSDRA
jgi:hypothetical protein